jgi:chorismate synthase
MNTFGTRFRVTIFGESHGPGVGGVVEGVPPGLRIDFERVRRELERRAPGRNEFSTQRREEDAPEILSGVKDGTATGGPIACLFHNRDVRSQDYPSPFRPGHADWTAFVKSRGFEDRRGGGRFSGRLTAGLVFAGALGKQILQERGIQVYARVKRLGGISDGIDLTGAGGRGDDPGMFRALLERLAYKDFPCAEEVEAAFKGRILEAKEERDSVGGVIEAVCVGLPAGVGEPFFDSVESHIARMLFAIPGVKGVEFGGGFALADLRGGEANDPIRLEEGCLLSETNRSGGILGGITNGMPLILRAAVKPTPSIGLPQKTVDPSTMTECLLELKGRHDPCIAFRAVPVVEAGVVIALLDLMHEGGW